MTQMAAPAFTKFDARAFRQNEDSTWAVAKPAKVAKAPEPEAEQKATLASLASLAADEERSSRRALDKWSIPEEERASIVEYDGGAPRRWAEGLARLDPARPPGDVPEKRWVQFIDDCGRFLDDGWACRAEELGWGPLDLFGCDRERPFARVDHLGLLWLVRGGRILELHRARAILRTTAGALQSYRRRPVEVGRVVIAWQLVHDAGPETTLREG
jgi:hypothetical protein